MTYYFWLLVGRALWSLFAAPVAGAALACFFIICFIFLTANHSSYTTHE